jgi:hypothetical protein
MGGRKWREGRIRPQAASDVFSRVVAILEELFTTSAEEASRRRDWWPGRPSSGKGIGAHVQ